MNNDNDLKSVDSGNWFHTLITRSEKNTALDLCTQKYNTNNTYGRTMLTMEISLAYDNIITALTADTHGICERSKDSIQSGTLVIPPGESCGTDEQKPAPWRVGERQLSKTEVR